MEGTFGLIEDDSGNYFDRYNIGGGGFIFRGESKSSDPGTLIITNFDPDNFIISGTFEFTASDDAGNTVEITEGRFDMNYTN